MTTDDPVLSIPAHSLIRAVDERNRHYYLTLAIAAPDNVTKLLFSPRTGAFVRGIAKTNGLDQNMAPLVSFAILRVAIGEKTLAQLPALLSTELKIANDKAQKIAQEIERDLFAPVALELNQYVAQKKKKAGSMADKMSEPPAPTAQPAPRLRQARPTAPPNILNLKDGRKPPTPPPIPK